MQLGQKLLGRLGSYTIQEQLYRTIYSAITSSGQRVIVKTERVTHQLNNEKGILSHFRNTPHIRELIDEVNDPPALVLNRLDGDILDAVKEQAVTGRDLKYVARVVLERLADMHEAGFIHTDVKPRNILVNYGKGKESDRFSEVQLTDFGDAFPVKASTDPKVAQPLSIGSALWRSPEALLGLRWEASTDIWSYGATLLSLLYGSDSHAFRPLDGSCEDSEYQFQVLVRQASRFGPFPDSMKELANEDARAMMEKAWTTAQDAQMYRPFEELPEDEFPVCDKEFLMDVLKLDPHNRPRASQLLRHRWFGDGRLAGQEGLHTG